MRLAIDVDGVLAEFIGSFTQLAFDVGATNRPPIKTADQPEWDFPWNTKPVWEAVKQSFNWWMTLGRLVSRTEITHLNHFIEAHDVYFVTSRPRTRGLSAELQTRHWLSGIGVYTDGASVIATQAGSKGALAKALDIDIALEDSPQSLADYAAHGICVVARRWPYNEGFEPHAVSLGHFLTMVENGEC